MRYKFFSILTAMLAAICLAGCNKGVENNEDTSPESSAETPFTVQTESYGRDTDPEAEKHSENAVENFYLSKSLSEKEFYPNEKSVRFMGRHIEHDGVQYLSYTCSSIDFILTGDKAEAVIVSNGHVYDDNQQAWLAVLVNGKPEKRFKVDGGENTYTLYEGKMLYNARITVMKLSENQNANVGVKSITANARKIAPAYPKELMIEFIGDSLTCGYGNEGSVGKRFSSADENGMAAYPYLTAAALDADYSMVCVSGIGVISDYTDERGYREDYLLMGENYEYSDWNFQTRRGISDLEKWDFGDGSDIAVINLGTNDYTYTGENGELKDEFSGAYYDLIAQVREHNPDAEIICSLGITGSELLPEIEDAAQRFSSDTGDKKIHTFKFSFVSDDDGFGTDYHPSVKAHETAADELTEFIKSEILK